jgi:hypothetical protein
MIDHQLLSYPTYHVVRSAQNGELSAGGVTSSAQHPGVGQRNDGYVGLMRRPCVVRC